MRVIIYRIMKRGCCFGCYRQRRDKGRRGILTRCSGHRYNLQKPYIDQLPILMTDPIMTINFLGGKMANRNGNYTAFYVAEPFNASRTGNDQ